MADSSLAAGRTLSTCDASKPQDSGLLGLPLDVLRGCIVSKLTHTDMRSLAATSSAALAINLQTCPRLKLFEVDPALVSCMARHQLGATRQQLASIQCRLVSDTPQGSCWVHLPLHLVPGICAEHVAATRDLPGPSANIYQLPQAALAAVVRVENPRQLSALPPGMAALEEVSLGGGLGSTTATWLPVSSAAHLRVLDAAQTRLGRVAEGMHALQGVDVSSCLYLDLDWLHADSASTVRTFTAADSNMQRLPTGMRELREVDVSNCQELAEEWLPPDCRGSVRVLKAARHGMSPLDACMPGLPAGLTALQELDISNSRFPGWPNWCPVDSATSVRTLRADSSHLSRLPWGMAALESVSVRECSRLSKRWLRGSSAARVCFLDATGSNKAHMTQLC
jgi:hypothetical protein